MNCEFHTDADKLIAVLSGEIDHHQVAPVRESIDEKIEAQKPKELVLDFSNTEFMDSSGIGMILGRYKLLNSLGGFVYINNPTKQVMKIIEIAGINRIIPVVNDYKKQEVE